MKNFGLREANQQFGRLVRAVRRGEEVILTDRGRPIAVVKPLAGAGTLIDRMVAKGVLMPAKKPGRLPDFRPLRVKGGLTGAVLAERRERD